MKKVMMIGLVAALLATACGGSSDGDPGVVADGTEAAADKDANANNEAAQSSASGGEDGSGIVEPEDTSNVAGNESDEVEEKTPDPSTTENPPSSGSADEETAGEPTAPAITHPNAQVATAMTDLVKRIGASVDAIELVSVEEVTWSDGSIGCPQPGMRYTQAIVNGTRIILRISGADYEYHSGGSREVFYCENPSDPVPGGDYGDV